MALQTFTLKNNLDSFVTITFVTNSVTGAVEELSLGGKETKSFSAETLSFETRKLVAKKTLSIVPEATVSSRSVNPTGGLPLTYGYNWISDVYYPEGWVVTYNGINYIITHKHLSSVNHTPPDDTANYAAMSISSVEVFFNVTLGNVAENELLIKDSAGNWKSGLISGSNVSSLPISKIDGLASALDGKVNAGGEVGSLFLTDVPTVGSQAINKEYADNTYLALSGGEMGGNILLYGDPTDDYHPIPRIWGQNNFLSLSGGTMTGPITGAHGLLEKEGGVMTGALLLSGTPTQPAQATHKSYVDAAGDSWKDGGTMSGTLILNAAPSGSDDANRAVTRGYVDSAVVNLLSSTGSQTFSGILEVDGSLTKNGNEVATEAYVRDKVGNFDVPVRATSNVTFLDTVTFSSSIHAYGAEVHAGPVAFTGNATFSGGLTMESETSFEADISLGGNAINNLPSPVTRDQPATKGYVDDNTFDISAGESNRLQGPVCLQQTTSNSSGVYEDIYTGHLAYKGGQVVVRSSAIEISQDYTVSNNVSSLFVDTSLGLITITIPPEATLSDISVKKIRGTGPVVIQGQNTVSAGMLTTLDSIDESVTLSPVFSTESQEFAVSADTSSNLFRVSNGYSISYKPGDLVVFSTSDTLPSPVLVRQYYVLADALSPTTFKVSETFNGPAITLLNQGQGTLRVTRRRVYWAATGKTIPNSTELSVHMEPLGVPCTLNYTTGVFTSVRPHNFSPNDRVRLRADTFPSATPAISYGIDYYIIPNTVVNSSLLTTTTFKLSINQDGDNPFVFASSGTSLVVTKWAPVAKTYTGFFQSFSTGVGNPQLALSFNNYKVFTATASSDLLTCVGPHLFTEGQPVKVTSTGTLPAPLATTDSLGRAKVYYVLIPAVASGVNPATQFRLSETQGGGSVTMSTNASTFTHTVSPYGILDCRIQDTIKISDLSNPAASAVDGGYFGIRSIDTLDNTIVLDRDYISNFSGSCNVGIRYQDVYVDVFKQQKVWLAVAAIQYAAGFTTFRIAHGATQDVTSGEPNPARTFEGNIAFGSGSGSVRYDNMGVMEGLNIGDQVWVRGHDGYGGDASTSYSYGRITSIDRNYGQITTDIPWRSTDNLDITNVDTVIQVTRMVHPVKFDSWQVSMFVSDTLDQNIDTRFVDIRDVSPSTSSRAILDVASNSGVIIGDSVRIVGTESYDGLKTVTALPSTTKIEVDTVFVNSPTGNKRGKVWTSKNYGGENNLSVLKGVGSSKSGYKNMGGIRFGKNGIGAVRISGWSPSFLSAASAGWSSGNVIPVVDTLGVGGNVFASVSSLSRVSGKPRLFFNTAIASNASVVGGMCPNDYIKVTGFVDNSSITPITLLSPGMYKVSGRNAIGDASTRFVALDTAMNSSGNPAVASGQIVKAVRRIDSSSYSISSVGPSINTAYQDPNDATKTALRLVIGTHNILPSDWVLVNFTTPYVTDLGASTDESLRFCKVLEVDATTVTIRRFSYALSNGAWSESVKNYTVAPTPPSGAATLVGYRSLIFFATNTDSFFDTGYGVKVTSQVPIIYGKDSTFTTTVADKIPGYGFSAWEAMTPEADGFGIPCSSVALTASPRIRLTP